MDECMDKNMIDKDEYPQTAEIEARCVHMLADLWNSPEAANTMGCSTTQRLAHDFGLAGKQDPERKWHAEYPLTHGLMGQYFIYQQGSTFCHTTCPATGAEAPVFATEGDQVLRMASLTLHSQKTMLKTATF